MRVFVTGGHGFIGSSVVRQLLDQDYSVRCLVRPTSDTSRIDGLSWERFEGDVRDVECLKKGMQGCDGVLHLASPSSWDDINSPVMEEVVVKGTANVLEAAKQAGVKRIVFCSSIIAVNGSIQPEIFDEKTAFQLTDERLVYAQCKHRAENLCLEASAAGQEVVIVNPAEVYGPKDEAMVTAGNLIDFAQSNPVLVCNGGTSVVFVDDVALGIIRALEKGRSGERYILGGDNLTVRELAELSLRLLEKKNSIITVPNPVLKAITSVATTLKIPLPYNPLVIPYATRYWFVDNRKAREELGVEFRSAADALVPTLDWLRETGRLSAN